MMPAVSRDRAVLCHKIYYNRAIFQCNLNQESFQISILNFFPRETETHLSRGTSGPCSWDGPPPKWRNTVSLGAPVSCLKQVCSSISEGWSCYLTLICFSFSVQHGLEKYLKYVGLLTFVVIETVNFKTGLNRAWRNLPHSKNPVSLSWMPIFHLILLKLHQRSPFPSVILLVNLSENSVPSQLEVVLQSPNWRNSCQFTTFISQPGLGT